MPKDFHFVDTFLSSVRKQRNLSILLDREHAEIISYVTEDIVSFCPILYTLYRFSFWTLSLLLLIIARRKLWNFLKSLVWKHESDSYIQQYNKTSGRLTNERFYLFIIYSFIYFCLLVACPVEFTLVSSSALDEKKICFRITHTLNHELRMNRKGKYITYSFLNIIIAPYQKKKKNAKTWKFQKRDFIALTENNKIFFCHNLRVINSWYFVITDILYLGISANSQQICSDCSMPHLMNIHIYEHTYTKK